MQRPLTDRDRLRLLLRRRQHRHHGLHPLRRQCGPFPVPLDQGRGNMHHRRPAPVRQTRYCVAQYGAGQAMTAERAFAAGIRGFSRGNQLRAPAPLQG